MAKSKKDAFECVISGCSGAFHAAKGFCSSCYPKARRLELAGSTTMDEIKARRSLETSVAEAEEEPAEPAEEPAEEAESESDEGEAASDEADSEPAPATRVVDGSGGPGDGVMGLIRAQTGGLVGVRVEHFELAQEDVEADAIVGLIRTLSKLDAPARSRVLAYASSRFGDA